MTTTNKVPVRTPVRDRVYDVIDGERDYQDAHDPATENELTHGETLGRIDEQLKHALANFSTEPEGKIATINNLRILAGIAVRGLEALGPIPREYHVPASANIVGTLTMRDKGDKL